jgi:hypothetical protein
VVVRVIKVETTYYSSRGWESGCPGRVVGGSGADLMVQFQLKRGNDGMKHCQKMKQRQQPHLGSMERKCDMARRRGDVSWRRGGTREETTPVELTRILLDLKIKKIHAIDSFAING